MTGVDDLLRGRPTAATSRLRAGRVSKVTAAGEVYVTLDGGDERHPLGPCSGARHRPAGPCPAGAHDHPTQPLPIGTRVLLATTVDGPWVVSWEDPAP